MEFLPKYAFVLDKSEISAYNSFAFGVWRSLVSRLVRDQEASGSNPDTPTISSVHNGFELWTLDFFVISSFFVMYEQVLCLLFCFMRIWLHIP